MHRNVAGVCQVAHQHVTRVQLQRAGQLVNHLVHRPLTGRITEPTKRAPRHLVGVHDLSVRNRSDFVQWLTPRVVLKTFNIDAFVKSRVDNSFRRPDRIADEPVTPAFPWG